MSLTVTPELVAAAKEGAVSDDEFLSCVKSSLPLAWGIINGLVEGFNQETGSRFNPPTLDEATRGQVLRMFASDAIRGLIQRHTARSCDGAQIAFQNCHAVSVFPNTDAGVRGYTQFTSVNEQIIAQRPENVDC